MGWDQDNGLNRQRFKWTLMKLKKHLTKSLIVNSDMKKVATSATQGRGKFSEIAEILTKITRFMCGNVGANISHQIVENVMTKDLQAEDTHSH